LLFGPIIGIFIGAATDLLSIALTAGMFHYGYFIAAMMYGLLSGIVKTILNITRGKQVRFIF
jgi:LytS/YehU family sensor histidine kinase